jgi:Putative adhesin
VTTAFRVASALLLVTATAGAQGTVGRNEASYTVREQLASGDRLRLTSPNGTINIVQSSGSDVEVRIDKTMERRAAIDDIAFIVKRSANGLIVCAVYDDDDSCDLERGHRQRSSNWNGRNRARANFTVRVPASVSVTAESGNGDLSIAAGGSDVDANTGNGQILITGTSGRVKAHTGNGRIVVTGISGRVDASTGNGRVEVEGATGEVDAYTGNGDVRVATSSGPVKARSGNGNIDVAMERLAGAHAMSFSTGSGRIVLALPEGFGAELESTTGNGAISSDFPVRVEGRLSPNRLRGTLGSGGERLAVSTGNGDIEIKRAH